MSLLLIAFFIISQQTLAETLDFKTHSSKTSPNVNEFFATDYNFSIAYIGLGPWVCAAEESAKEDMAVYTLGYGESELEARTNALLALKEERARFIARMKFEGENLFEPNYENAFSQTQWLLSKRTKEFSQKILTCEFFKKETPASLIIQKSIEDLSLVTSAESATDFICTNKKYKGRVFKNFQIPKVPYVVTRARTFTEAAVLATNLCHMTLLHWDREKSLARGSFYLGPDWHMRQIGMAGKGPKSPCYTDCSFFAKKR